MERNQLSILWDRYADILWEPGKHKEACRGYAAEIQAIMNERHIDAFDNSLLDAITASLRSKGNRNSTINRKMACLSKLLRKHQRNGGIARLPDFAKLPERNGRIRFLSQDEEAFLFSSLDAIDAESGALARFLINTGSRIGESLQLRWSDVNDRNVTFWETKTNEPRTVPLTRIAVAVLDQQRGRVPLGPFANVRYPAFLNAWNQAKQRSGLGSDKQVVPHVLRHTCASRLAQRGVDIKRIQEFLGHKTLAMTLRYAHLAPKHLEVCAQKLDEFAEDATGAFKNLYQTS
jgi:integrase